MDLHSLSSLQGSVQVTVLSDKLLMNYKFYKNSMPFYRKRHAVPLHATRSDAIDQLYFFMNSI